MKLSLILLSSYLLTLSGFIPVNNNFNTRTQTNRIFNQAYEFSLDDGELSWEDIIASEINPPIKFPMGSFTDSNCKEINDTNIELKVCSILNEKEISFNIDGVINKSFIRTYKPYSNEIANNVETLLEENIEFAILVMIMTTIVKQVTYARIEDNRFIQQIINVIGVITTVMLKSSKRAE